MSCGKEVAARYHSIALGYCVGVQRDLRECRESLMPAAGRGSPTPAVHVASQLSVNVASRPPSAADSSRRPPLSPLDPVRQFRPGVPFSGPWIQFPGYGQESRSKVKPAGRSRYLTSQPATTLFDQPLTLSCPVCLALRGLPVCYLSPGGFLIPTSYPMDFYLGVVKLRL